MLRTRRQWRALPKERFSSASAIHARFLEWERAVFFEVLWEAGLAEYDDLQGIAWHWQSIDGAMMKTPLGQEAAGPTPTDRGENGSKRHLLVNGRGIPLSLIVSAASRHDVTQLEAVIARQKRRRPAPARRRSKYLCADNGYRGALAKDVIEREGYIPHVQG